MSSLMSLVRSKEASEKACKRLRDALIYIGSICESNESQEACKLIVGEVKRVLGMDEDE